jgi:hypothetical protein
VEELEARLRELTQLRRARNRTHAHASAPANAQHRHTRPRTCSTHTRKYAQVPGWRIGRPRCSSSQKPHASHAPSRPKRSIPAAIPPPHPSSRALEEQAAAQQETQEALEEARGWQQRWAREAQALAFEIRRLRAGSPAAPASGAGPEVSSASSEASTAAAARGGRERE